MNTHYEFDGIKLYTEDQVDMMCQVKVHESGPLLVHQRFCMELVKVCKDNPGKILRDLPQAAEVLTAIEVLERCYPKLKRNEVELKQGYDSEDA